MLLMDQPTLLEGLCKANGCQGGTIHQYFARHSDWYPMQDAYRKLVAQGIKFTKDHFNSLAKGFGLTITWG